MSINSFLEKIDQDTLDIQKVELEEKQYDYKILKKELNPELPNFALMNPLGISEEVPIAHRQLWVKHELFHLINNNSCLEATKKELALVPQEIYDKHLSLRIKFYHDLINFSENINSKKEIIKAFQQSLSHLQGIYSVRNIIDRKLGIKLYEIYSPLKL